MAKTRIGDLARKLNVQSKDIVDFLRGKKIEVTNGNNTIEEDTVNMVNEKFTKTSANSDAKNDTTEKTAERSKKKSSISAVFNPQNSKQASGKRQIVKNGQKMQEAKENSEKAVSEAAEAHGSTENQDNDEKENKRGDRGMNRNNRNGDRNNNRTDRNGERGNNRTDRNGDRNNNRTDRNGERGNRTDRNGDYGNRGNNRGDRNGERGNRGDRNGDRVNNRDNRTGDRNNNRDNRGNYGNRNNNNNRDNRTGDRNNNRNANGRNNNSRNGYNNDRNNNRGGYNSNDRSGRFEKEMSRFNKDSAARVMPEEVRTKESRDRDNNRKNKRAEHDVLGGKKQERFTNLEKNGGKKKKPQPKPVQKEEDTIKNIIIPEKLTIKDLADKMKVQGSAIVKKLFMQGKMYNINQEIDFETAEEIALEFNCIAELEEKVDVIAELLKEQDEDESRMVPRPPVVCVMGHVDHGKTSLLDAIRETRVTDREAGGITQHIGASVVTCNGQNITFLDTPGHEAFTAMRMRGANSTDIAVLVVAADDGVMPQTVEAINHAKAAGVEIIVAVNKIDKPSANIERVKQELAEYELIPEDWGGSTIFVPVSAKTREGIDQLLEMILLTAEVLELKANPDRTARGMVLEAKLDKGRGAVATVLVQKGTLHVGDPIAAGSCYGKVRAMIDDQGRRVKEAKPSTPVEILGLSAVPNAGEIFVSMPSEKEARSFAETFISEGKNKLIEDTKSKMSLDDLFSQIQSGNVKELNLIVKADVQGSVEAVKQSLVKLSNDEVVVKVIHGGVGAINESDVILASASNAIIIGFNVRPDVTAKATADREGVDLRLYKVIYNAIEDVAAAMKGMLDPIFEEKVLGHAEIRQLFKASGVGNIAGSYVLDGVFQRGCMVRISREGEQIFEGNLASLKRFKDDVKEVKAGYECGLVFEGFNEIQELDIVEAYTMVEVPR